MKLVHDAGKFKRTKRQLKLIDLIGSDATHIMAEGGSRSGKTFLFVEMVIVRAVAEPNSRHGIFRFRLNDTKSKILLDTFPKVIRLCFPPLHGSIEVNKADMYVTLPNGSEIWFAGLDDKERTEKVLGGEFSTLFFNECSQIPFQSRNIAVTRLAQKNRLRLKALYDCNPPSTAHWTYKMFTKKVDPDSGRPLPNPENYGHIYMNPEDNRENLPKAYFDELNALPERQRRRFLLGLHSDAADGALWTEELMDQQRHEGALPEMARIVIAVDPSGCRGPEDTRSDEIGIIVAGLGVDGYGYILEDLSGRYGPGTWGGVAVEAYRRHEADRIVGEINYGGAMVEEVIRAAAAAADPPVRVSYREVVASRGKTVRAEPVAALFEQGKVYMAGRFDQLETQLVAMTVSGYTGTRSPDRADAMVFALAELFQLLTKRKEDPFKRTPEVIMSRPVKARPQVIRRAGYG